MKFNKIIYSISGILFFVGLVMYSQSLESTSAQGVFLMILSVTILVVMLFKRMFQKITQMSEEGEREIQAYNEKRELFGIPNNAKSIKVLASGENSRFKVFNNSECKVWLDSNMLNLYHDEVLTGIEIDDIKCFARIGDIKQGEYSLSNAIAGYLLLGVAGAVIGSKKKDIDNRQTVLIINEEKEEDCLILSSDSYEILLSIIPRKELTVANQIAG